MSPKKTLWPLKPHTRGKHLVLKSYLEAWLPILGSWTGRILFIDGFAGPGEYDKGEEGSPLIALRAFKDHRFRKVIKSEVRFIFIEKRKDRYEHLEKLIDPLRSSLPEKCYVDLTQGAFDETMTTVLDALEEHAQKLAPALVMVDPFGVSDTPMSVLQKILRNNRSEVYISFMYSYIDRFRNNPDFETPLDNLYGCQDWRHGRSIEEPEERKAFFYDLYEKQLRTAGAKQVVRFELYEGKRLIYAIFFGTHHWKGSNVMKRAISTVDPGGNFAFKGTRSTQLSLLTEEPDFTPLRSVLCEQFGSRGWIKIEEVLEFVGSDKTDFYTDQLRRGALKPMERSGEIEVDVSTRKRKLSYPPGTKLRFGQ